MQSRKINTAIELISSVINDKSIVMSSFGKDSIVMLNLIKRAGFKLPILFFREPFFPKKYEFANSIILDNDYVVYDYPPTDNAFSKIGDSIEIINYHQISQNPIKSIYLPTGVISPKNGKDYLCGFKDIYNKPKCSYDFPWDIILVGHKSTDKDKNLGGVIELIYDKFTDKDNGKTFVFPLRHFTDEDIWEYTIKENLPINTKRYNKDDNWKEFKDITYNPDYFYACTACIDRDNEDEVFCPKLSKMIPNISGKIIYANNDFSHYIKVREE